MGNPMALAASRSVEPSSVETGTLFMVKWIIFFRPHLLLMSYCLVLRKITSVKKKKTLTGQPAQAG
jgi:hypothetical protein